MWAAQISVPVNGVSRYELRRAGTPVTWAETLQLWAADTTFQDFFSQLLASAAAGAFFWETPPVTLARRDQAFEFVLVEAPQLVGVPADAQSFRDHFRDGAPVVAFDNLGRDARLIAPCPSAGGGYPHLAAFIRNAPAAQQRALWARVGQEAGLRCGPAPLWISTSGLGVYWLHIRLDSVPKYYTWRPYRDFAAG